MQLPSQFLQAGVRGTGDRAGRNLPGALRGFGNLEFGVGDLLLKARPQVSCHRQVRLQRIHRLAG